MKRWNLLGLFLMLAAAAFVSCSGDESSDGDLDGDVAETDGDVAETDGDVAETDGDVAETDGDVAETDGDVAETDGDVAETDGDVAETDGDATETDGDVAETDGDVTETDGDVAETDGDVTETDGDVAETDGDVAETDGESGGVDCSQDRGEHHRNGRQDPQENCFRCHGEGRNFCLECHQNEGHSIAHDGVNHHDDREVCCTWCHGPDNGGGVGPACADCHTRGGR